jgi:hypothetical protein
MKTVILGHEVQGVTMAFVRVGKNAGSHLLLRALDGCRCSVAAPSVFIGVATSFVDKNNPNLVLTRFSAVAL